MRVAEQDVNESRPQLAMARLSGILHTQGVRVAIDASSLEPGNLMPIWAAFAGLGRWEAVLGADNPIQVVPLGKPHDVTIRFAEQMHSRHEGCIGLIDLQQRYHWNSVRHAYDVRGTITLGLTHHGSPLSFDEVTHVAMHELGHLLGLADVNETGLLMGPMERGKPLPMPSAQEIDAVRRLRADVRVQLWSIVALSQPTRRPSYCPTPERLVAAARLR